jgi:hypothetical protein
MAYTWQMPEHYRFWIYSALTHSANLRSAVSHTRPVSVQRHEENNIQYTGCYPELLSLNQAVVEFLCWLILY